MQIDYKTKLILCLAENDRNFKESKITYEEMTREHDRLFNWYMNECRKEFEAISKEIFGREMF